MDTQTQDVFNAFVHITDDAGYHHAFAPGDPIPGWARPRIGDHVVANGWVAEPDHVTDDLIAQAPGFTAFGNDVQEDVPEVQPPPTSGPGSNRGAWAEFAKAVGQPVTTGMSRQDIIDALIRNGHLTE